MWRHRRPSKKKWRKECQRTLLLLLSLYAHTHTRLGTVIDSFYYPIVTHWDSKTKKIVRRLQRRRRDTSAECALLKWLSFSLLLAAEIVTSMMTKNKRKKRANNRHTNGTMMIIGIIRYTLDLLRNENPFIIFHFFFKEKKIKTTKKSMLESDRGGWLPAGIRALARAVSSMFHIIITLFNHD